MSEQVCELFVTQTFTIHRSESCSSYMFLYEIVCSKVKRTLYKIRYVKSNLSEGELMMKFIVIASYSKQGTDGWLDNPDDDRRTMISAMMERIGGSLHDLVYCRGEYDVVATVEAPDLDSMTALKLAMMTTGAIAQMSVLESIDLNAVARQGANLIGAYKAPGN